MKHHMTGKVIGVELWQPDPKNLPELEVAKVKVKYTTSVVEEESGMQVALHSTGTLVVPLVHVGHRGDFALGRTVTADFEDYQQELGLTRGRLSVIERDGEFFDSTTGEQVLEDSGVQVEIQIPGEKPIRTSAAEMRKALDKLKGRSTRTPSRHN